jgi:hypothetical protein
VRALIASIDGERDDTPEEIAKAWDENIARGATDLQAGRTVGIPAEQVLAEIRTMIGGHHGKR